MFYHRKVILFLIILIFCLTTCLSILASAATPIPIIKEIDLPHDLKFAVNKTCSRHAYFMQAAADENGCFVVYARHVNPDDNSEVDFKKVYIDIYNANGDFLKELSFNTSLDCAVEIDGDAISVYFYSSVLIYSLATEEIHHYEIPDGAAVNGDLYKELRSKEFTEGDWEYHYKRGLNGYVKLLRCDGTQTQVLVEMPGTSNATWKVILPGTAIGIIIVIIGVWHKMKRIVQEQGHSSAGGVGTGDGGAC